jgi:hypothetical protein
MTVVSRESIFDSLFDRVKASANFRTAARGFRHWDDVPAGERPALFLVEGDEEWPDRDWHKPAVLAFEAAVLIYAATGATPPDPQLATILNNLVDSVQASLAPPTPFRQPQTLGIDGVVMARIQGKIIKNPGYADGNAVAVIPIKITVAERY